MAITDPIDKVWVDNNAPWMKYVVPAIGAILVVLVGKALAKRNEKLQEKRGETTAA
jgi:hypothetical protein